MATNWRVQVLEYLSKKGYSKSEAMLRTESAARDFEGKPINLGSEEAPASRYSKAFSKSDLSQSGLTYPEMLK